MKQRACFRLALVCCLSGFYTVGCEQIEAVTPVTHQASETVTTPTVVAQKTDYQIVSLINTLEHPWGLAWLPDGSILITERPGRLRRFHNGQLGRPIEGMPNVFARGQGGLLDIALHPRFEENQWVYLTYSDGNRTNNRTRVARATFDGQSLQNWQVIFEVNRSKSGAQHFGSRLVWLPDETLLVSIGDGGNPPLSLDGELIRFQAQNLDSYLGKVIRIHDDGSIPADNPTIEGRQSAIWSYGHRNIQGMAYDAIANRVWATEHGSRGGDELNLIEPGENYGWPLVSHSQEYTSDRPVAPTQSRPGMVDPKIVWTPSIAPSGLTVYRGNQFPNWQGHLFAGALVNKDISRIQVDTEGQALEAEFIPIGQRVRAIRQGPDDLLYILTDETEGQLLRLEPSP